MYRSVGEDECQIASRVSDRFLTQKCGFLQMLEPGNLVLADREYTIEDDLQFVGTGLEIPAFM